MHLPQDFDAYIVQGLAVRSRRCNERSASPQVQKRCTLRTVHDVLSAQTMLNGVSGHGPFAMFAFHRQLDTRKWATLMHRVIDFAVKTIIRPSLRCWTAYFQILGRHPNTWEMFRSRRASCGETLLHLPPFFFRVTPRDREFCLSRVQTWNRRSEKEKISQTSIFRGIRFLGWWLFGLFRYSLGIRFVSRNVLWNSDKKFSIDFFSIVKIG